MIVIVGGSCHKYFGFMCTASVSTFLQSDVQGTITIAFFQEDLVLAYRSNSTALKGKIIISCTFSKLTFTLEQVRPERRCAARGEAVLGFPPPLAAIFTHTYSRNDFLPVKHATEAKLLFLRIL